MVAVPKALFGADEVDAVGSGRTTTLIHPAATVCPRIALSRTKIDGAVELVCTRLGGFVCEIRAIGPPVGSGFVGAVGPPGYGKYREHIPEIQGIAGVDIPSEPAPRAETLGQPEIELLECRQA